MEIQGYKSKLFELGDKSVVQGSRLASDLYTVYTLDIGKLDLVIRDRELFSLLTQNPLPELPEHSQENVAFVDDLSQVVGIDNGMELQMVTQTLYELSVSYFLANLLAINCAKTEVLSVPYKPEESEDIVLMSHDGEYIVSKQEVKILGIHFNASNNMSTHISKTASRVGLAYKNMLPYLNHSNINQRKILIKSKIESIALYGSPLIFNETEHIQKRFFAILMKINKWILRENTFRKANKEICAKLKIDEPEQTFLKSNVLHIAKIVKDREVGQIMEKLYINNRIGSKIYFKDPQKPSSRSSLIRHVDLYNALSLDTKAMKISSLKRKFKKHDVVFDD